MSTALLTQEYVGRKIQQLNATSLDPQFFSNSPPSVARCILDFFRNRYQPRSSPSGTGTAMITSGAIADAYFDEIGFDMLWRERLRKKMLEEYEIS